MLNRTKLATSALLLLLAPALQADVVPVEIVGLFRDTAVIRVPGGERMLRLGETTDQGVTLVSANAREAVVAYQGEQHTVGLSNRVSGSFQQAQVSQVSIPADDLGQYRIRGAINHNYVDFLIDTGASVVALSSADAESLGIDYTLGQKGTVQTAQGNAESYFLTLDRVTVAGITAHNVQAAVISGRYPLDVLLGMSFLKQVSLQETGGVLTLVQKH